MDHQKTIEEDVRRALAEDIGTGDVSAPLIDPGRQLETRLLVREDAVLCGSDWFNQVFHQCDSAIRVHWHARDADWVRANSELCVVSGPARGLLSGERSALNFLQTLSATATITHDYVQRVKQTGCRILDTRKTIPNLRLAQKYAVACGGGLNHRIGLFDAYLIKENHLVACGGIARACARARSINQQLLLIVEVETLAQLEQAIAAGADRALLDNFSLPAIKQAVNLSNKRIQLEASGNISVDDVIEIASTGVDFISVGALTKNIRAIDFSLRFTEPSAETLASET